MLKYKEIIDNLTIKQKIAILTSTMDAEELKALKIPVANIANVWDGNHLETGEILFPSAKSLANSWDNKLFGDVCVNLSTVQAKNTGANLFIMPHTNASSSVYSNALAEEPYLSGHMVAGATRAFAEKQIPASLNAPMLTDEDAKMLDIDADLSSVYERSVYPYRLAQNEGKPCAVIIPENCENKSYADANEKFMSFLPDQLAKISKIDNGDLTTLELAKGRLLLGGSASAIETSYENYLNIYRSMQEGGATAHELQMTLSDGAAISDEIIDSMLDEKLDLAYHCERNQPTKFNFDELETLSYVSARDSMVLLKNQNVLPLRRGEKVAIIGDIIYDGEDCSFKSFGEEVAKHFNFDGINVTGFAQGYNINRERSEELIAPALHVAQTADTVFVFVGLGKAREMNLNKSHHLGLPANQKALISALVKLRRRVVAVVVGEHLPAMDFDKKVQATLFIPSQGKGVAKAFCDIVSGKYSPSGKLAVSGFDNPDADFRTMQKLKKDGKRKIGPFVGYRYLDSSGNTMRYPVGHGLSYANFSYSTLTVTGQNVTFAIQNTSNFSASETIQVYISKPDSARARPIKELKAIEKIMLSPRERRIISIPLKELGIYDEKRGDVILEDGKYEVMVGPSPSNIRLHRKISLLGEKLSPQKFNLSDYLYSVSNIRSEGYTMEAHCINMNKKSKLKLTGILFIAITLFADVVYGVGGLLAGIDFEESLIIFAILNAVGLIVGGILLLIYAIKNKRAKIREEKFEREAAEELFRDVEKINAHALEELFVEEFDALYEEEQRQDEESFAKDESTFAYMAVDTDLKSASVEMEKFFEENGLAVTIETTRAILSSIMSARLLVIRTDRKDKYQKFISVISKYFGTEYHEDSFKDYNGYNKTLWQSGKSPLAETFYACEVEENKVHFLSICDIKLADAGKVLMPYVQYLGNPEEGHTAEEDGETVTIPSNVWFILNPAENEELDTIPAYISNLSMVIDLDCQICQEKTEKTPVKLITCPQMEALLYRSKKSVEIDEELWKNIDKLEEFVNDKVPYHIGNKLCLQLESYMSVCETAGAPVSEAIDGAISAKLLPTILTLLKDNAEMADIDLAETFESIFGDENVSRCRSMIKHIVVKSNEDTPKAQQKVEVKVEPKIEAKIENKQETKVEENKSTEEKPTTQTKTEEKPQGEDKDVK